MPDKPFFADLMRLPEAERILIIGREAEKSLVGFVVEDNEKADRYIEQLQKAFRIRVVSRGSGPIKDTILVKMGPIAH